MDFTFSIAMAMMQRIATDIPSVIPPLSYMGLDLACKAWHLLASGRSLEFLDE